MTPEDAVRISIRRAFRNMKAPEELKKLLKDADQELGDRLVKVSQKGLQGRFSEAQVIAYRKQIAIVQKAVEKRLQGMTEAEVEKSLSAAIKGTTRDLKRLDQAFTGVVTPLSLDESAQFSSTVNGVKSSLLSQNASSVQRYGQAMIRDFEGALQRAFVTGASQLDTIKSLVDQAPQGIAKTLWEKEPAYFPEPTGFIKKGYWAERIVRTEKAYAYNAGNQRALEVTRTNDFPDLKKKILAHFDARTAPDSIGVHGQVRPVDGLFQDGNGRQYKHPPARPNDRETVIPWRDRWEETSSTKPVEPAEVEDLAKAKALEIEEKRKALKKKKAPAKKRPVKKAPAKKKAPKKAPKKEAPKKEAPKASPKEHDPKFWESHPDYKDDPPELRRARAKGRAAIERGLDMPPEKAKELWNSLGLESWDDALENISGILSNPDRGTLRGAIAVAEKTADMYLKAPGYNAVGMGIKSLTSSARGMAGILGQQSMIRKRPKLLTPRNLWGEPAEEFSKAASFYRAVADRSVMVPDGSNYRFLGISDRGYSTDDIVAWPTRRGKTSVRVLVHEMGHGIDYRDRGRTLALRQYRGKKALSHSPSPKLRRLNELADRDYDDSEVGYEDKYLEPYMGKVYEDEDMTEVGSMALEALYGDRYRFRDDPEVFELALGHLQGDQ